MDLLSYLDCKVHSTVKQEDDIESWKKERTSGIGGSDIGVICGVNKYGSIKDLYFKKTLQYTDGILEPNKAALQRMHFGHVLEPVVADEFARVTGKKIVACPATLKHRKYDYLLANVDRFIVDDEGRPIGVLECKSASEHLAKDWEEGTITPSYYYQLHHYMLVTGLKYGALACLVGGNKFYYYEIYRNEDVIEEIITKASVFWNHNVKNLVEPEPTGSDGDTEYINETNKEVVPKQEIVLADTENELAKTIVESKAAIKKYEKIISEAQNRIKDKMRENEIGITDDYVIKWSLRKTNRVDTELLKSKYVKVYEDCLKACDYRVMLIKGGK